MLFTIFFQNVTCTVENLMRYFRAGLFTGSGGTGYLVVGQKKQNVRNNKNLTHNTDLKRQEENVRDC